MASVVNFDWVLVIGEWQNYLLALCVLTPIAVACGLSISTDARPTLLRAASIAAAPSAVIGAVIGAWICFIAVAGVGALFCGMSCAESQYDLWLNVSLIVGAVFGAGLGYGTGFLLGLAAAFLTDKIFVSVDTEAEQ